MSEPSGTYGGKRYDAFVTREYQGKEDTAKKDWTKVGVAFPHKSGKGFTLKIAPQISLSGDVVILEHEESTGA
ncbi:MAG: hypothetical protein M3O20_17675 [Acidobacteriota bacterium]|nr:hypothetical protein [Acidobacteriota bacterium]